MQRLPLESLLGQLAFGDVPRDALDRDDVAVLAAHQTQALLDPDGRVVLAAHPKLPRPIEVGVLKLLHHLPVLRLDNGEDQLGIRVQLCRRVTRNRFACRAHVVEPAIRLQPVAEDEVVRVVRQQAQALLGDLDARLSLHGDSFVVDVVGGVASPML